jgi:hypothetical protein
MAGNATLALYNGSGFTTYEIWLQSINTSTNNQFSTQQTKEGMNWIPIRRAEMFVNVTAVWSLVSVPNRRPDLGYENIDPADGFAKMNKLQDAIHQHQLAIINGATTVPMKLNYYNNNAHSPIFNELISSPGALNALQYDGWIQSVEKQYDKSKNVFYTNYHMNILTPNIANTPPTNMSTSITYAPSAALQSSYGADWLNIPAMAAKAPKVLNTPG